MLAPPPPALFSSIHSFIHSRRLIYENKEPWFSLTSVEVQTLSQTAATRRKQEPALSAQTDVGARAPSHTDQHSQTRARTHQLPGPRSPSAAREADSTCGLASRGHVKAPANRRARLPPSNSPFSPLPTPPSTPPVRSLQGCLSPPGGIVGISGDILLGS